MFRIMKIDIVGIHNAKWTNGSLILILAYMNIIVITCIRHFLLRYGNWNIQDVRQQMVEYLRDASSNQNETKTNNKKGTTLRLLFNIIISKKLVKYLWSLGNFSKRQKMHVHSDSQTLYMTLINCSCQI